MGVRSILPYFPARICNRCACGLATHDVRRTVFGERFGAQCLARVVRRTVFSAPLTQVGIRAGRASSQNGRLRVSGLVERYIGALRQPVSAKRNPGGLVVDDESKCPVSGKRKYATEGEALSTAAHQIATTQAPKDLRAYLCSWCDAWHLTKNVGKTGKGRK
jgi:hypothetical protein